MTMVAQTSDSASFIEAQAQAGSIAAGAVRTLSDGLQHAGVASISTIRLTRRLPCNLQPRSSEPCGQ